MKKPTIETLTKRLKRLNSKLERQRKKRDKLPQIGWSISAEKGGANLEINRVCGEIMRLERQIINALLAQLP